MSNITIIGSGMMGSAMARPASDNGHQVRLVGSPLDDHIIAALKAGKDHPTLKRSFAGVATPYYITELQEALKDADVVLAGISTQACLSHREYCHMINRARNTEESEQCFSSRVCKWMV